MRTGFAPRLSLPTPCGSRGFTLIEILVVLVILGVAVAMIGVNLAADRRQTLDAEAKRLVFLLEQARDEAMSSGTSIAFSAGADAYRFQHPVQTKGENGARQWQEYGVAEAFRPRRLPEGVKLAGVEVNGQRAEGERPLVFTPSGVIPSFRLQLVAGEYRVVVSGTVTGRITLTPSGEQS